MKMAKNVEKRYVSKGGVEKALIRRQVREKVLKSLGIKSLDEIKGDKGLQQKYLNEYSKFIKVKKLKPLNLKFVDGHGNIAKEVPIGYKTVISTVGVETGKSPKSLWGDKLLPGRKIEQHVMRDPVVARFQKVAVVSEIISEFAVAESSAEAKSFDGTDGANLGVESSLEYYDEKGNMQWKKNFDWNLSISPIGVSEKGEIVAVIQRCEQGCWMMSKETPLLVIFDSLGKELLSFPSIPGETCNYGGDFWLSLEGKYVMLACVAEKGWPKSILISIKERKFWRAPYLIGIGRGDDGYEIREGSKLRVAVTGPNELGSTSTEIDLEKLSWELLPQ